jgi:hypothetical protein
MAQTQPSPYIDSARRQHTMHARQSAVRIRSFTEQILLDIAHGRPVRANGRKVATEALALCEALAALGLAEEMAARTMREAAA